MTIGSVLVVLTIRDPRASLAGLSYSKASGQASGCRTREGAGISTAGGCTQRGVRYTIMRMEGLDPAGIVQYYWSTLASILHAPHEYRLIAGAGAGNPGVDDASS